ncbi:MAG: DUF3054 domain-containing protein [Nesterenkonia sp.]|uniref:DUF3054 domain-containing protein n=1 Tax=Nesterenkonia marinintestina TaxID=2979865 RepID=UPI0021C05CC9|nr:DUF3054 domain-containing protein [Nesterenkonia sp. GX14115]MDO5492278.1 DUF3054 domain-containing protein [Nesterenkonia sp.]
MRWSLLLIDGGLVVLFAVLGNRSHDTGLGIGDVLGTAGPFLVALILTTLLLRGHRRPSRMVPDGLVVWTGTVAGGMLLRAATDLGGVQVSFVLVAAGVLGVLLCGRRLLTGLLLPATRG